MKKLILIGFAFIATISCSSYSVSKSKIGSKQPSIENTKWILADNVKGKTPTLVIESDKISGNAGCNNYFGKITLNTAAGDFSANPTGTTKMYCDNLDEEDNFMKMLEEANKYVVLENTLELYKNNLLLMKFNKQ
jgi:heat shock protein HslJ